MAAAESASSTLPEESSSVKLEDSMSETQSQDSPVPKKQKKTMVIIISILVVLLLFAGGLVTFLLLTGSGDSDDEEDKEDDKKIEKSEDEDDETEDTEDQDSQIDTGDDSDDQQAEDAESEEEDWLAYTNTEFEVDFKYPESWFLNESNTGTSECRGLDVSVSKDSYSFEAQIPCASGPSVCVYSDTDPSSYSTEGPYIEYENYTQVVGTGVIFRRTESADRRSYSVCRKSGDGFITWNAPGFISYKIPAGDPHPDYLGVMDEILKSW